MDFRKAIAMMALATTCIVASQDAGVKKPTIAILATGGTIAGSSDSETSSAYTAGAKTVDQLLAAVPEINNLATIKGEQVAKIGSQSMNNKVWFDLAKRIDALLSGSEVDGIVITHGTDTMEETAYFLDLIVKSNKPVVLVGAMRNADSLSADGPLNLYNAVAVAADKKSVGKGVLVVMNGEIHAAREVVKSNTTDVQTFKSPNAGPLGLVNYAKVKYYMESTREHTTKTDFKISDIKSAEDFPNVQIVYAHANHDDLFLKAAINAKVKGIVFAGVGNGNFSDDVEAALKEAVAAGITVVRGTRLYSGEVASPGEVNDQEYGFIASDDLNVAKARVLLMLALTKTTDKAKIQEYFYKY